ncbi:MAG: glycosyltransferase [Kiritimatiellae bacterium]|nr:glycosyltransferase [Kiritimatiellia bacterium]
MKFSIITPVYNVAEFLRECVDSVRAQTFGDWELICVDDGSTDGSGEILDEYAREDNRIRVIHTVNAGASAARNTGLAAMHGEWFGFVDADDAIVPETLADIAAMIDEGAFDILQINKIIISEGGRCEKEPHGIDDKLGLLLDPKSGAWTVSRYMRRDRFGHLRFPADIKLREDLVYWVDAICVEDAKWAVVEKPFYKYRQHATSVSCRAQKFSDRMDLINAQIYAVERMQDTLGATKRDLEEYARLVHIYELLDGTMDVWPKFSKDEKRRLRERAEYMIELLGYRPFPAMSYLVVHGWPLRSIFVLWRALKRRFRRWLRTG